jgi:hypothetical protein
MLEQFEALHAADGGDKDSRAFDIMHPLAPWFAALLVRRIMELPAAERALPARQALAFAKILLEWPQLHSGELAVALVLASQAAVGDAAALDRWLDALPAKERPTYATIDKRQIGNMTRILKQPPLCGKEYDNPRRALLTALMMDPATIERQLASEYARNNAWDLQVYLLTVEAPRNGGLFTDEDMIAAIEMIPAKHPYRAEFLVKKATLIETHDATPEDILKTYDAAETAAAGDVKLIDVVRAYRVRYLAGKGQRPDEALAIAKTINLDHLSKRHQTYIQELLQRADAQPDKE